tara:strand:+ start:183 stop:449 length:267 start_codon:yes stop_codon:yes gene_type:complete
MAQTNSVKKRVRQAKKKSARNGARINRIRTFVRKVEDAILKGDGAEASAALKMAMPELHRGVSKGVIRKNTVSRKLSRLNKRIRSLTT